MVLKALFMVPAAFDFSFVYSWQTGPICPPPDYVRQSEPILCEPQNRRIGAPSDVRVYAETIAKLKIRPAASALGVLSALMAQRAQLWVRSS